MHIPHTHTCASHVHAHVHLPIHSLTQTQHSLTHSHPYLLLTDGDNGIWSKSGADISSEGTVREAVVLQIQARAQKRHLKQEVSRHVSAFCSFDAHRQMCAYLCEHWGCKRALLGDTV